MDPALVGGIAILVTLDVVGIGAAIVNARYSSSAKSKSETAAEAAIDALREVRSVRQRVDRAEIRMDNAEAVPDGGRES